MNPLFESIGAQLGIPLWLIIIVLVWTLIWKALALWKAAKRNHVAWFIAFFVIHTMGILEILYIFLFSKIQLEKKKSRASRRS